MYSKSSPLFKDRGLPPTVYCLHFQVQSMQTVHVDLRGRADIVYLKGLNSKLMQQNHLTYAFDCSMKINEAKWI